ncbi:MAG: hypothetical protein V2I32_03040 [Desulforhopalus sp.]|nr:hypothetical protein [Desulforhopalus sp.]
MKGYPVIIEKPQKRLLGFHKSKTFKNAHWEPKYRGSKDYELVGEEVEREAKTIYRIVWSESYRDAGGKVRKKQQHIANLQYWDVVWDFKEALLYRQGVIEGRSQKDQSGRFTSLKQSHLPGKVPHLEKAIVQFVRDGGDEHLFERIEKKLLQKDGPASQENWDFVMAKVLAKWLPIKEKIVREYVTSEEFRVWLGNEAMRKDGPREPTEEELRDQAENGEKWSDFRESFGSSFGSNGAEENRFESGESRANSIGGVNLSIGNREMALAVLKAGYRTLSKKYHPDHCGGDGEKMKELNGTYEELTEMFD